MERSHTALESHLVGVSSRCRYIGDLSSIAGLFAINSATGVVTVVGNINFEMGQEHDLTVEASDHGNPRRGNVASLLITVINAEDESPRFPISFYTASVDEGR